MKSIDLLESKINILEKTIQYLLHQQSQHKLIKTTNLLTSNKNFNLKKKSKELNMVSLIIIVHKTLKIK